MFNRFLILNYNIHNNGLSIKINQFYVLIHSLNNSVLDIDLIIIWNGGCFINMYACLKYMERKGKKKKKKVRIIIIIKRI